MFFRWQSWDEGRAATCNNLVDTREETFELFLLIGMRSATVRALEKKDVHLLRCSTGHEGESRVSKSPVNITRYAPVSTWSMTAPGM